MPQQGELYLTVIQFSTDATVEVPETQITAANAASVADAIRAIQQKHLRTNYEAAINAAIGAVDFRLAPQQVINISTDGGPNEGNTDPVYLRNLAVNGGFDEVDAELFGSPTATASDVAAPDAPTSTNAPVDVLAAMAYSQPALVIPLRYVAALEGRVGACRGQRQRVRRHRLRQDPQRRHPAAAETSNAPVSLTETFTPGPAPTNTPTAPVVVGLPNTGGAAPQGGASPWILVLVASVVGSLGALAFGLSIRAHRPTRR